jgi:hypothetical protein
LRDTLKVEAEQLPLLSVPFPDVNVSFPSLTAPYTYFGYTNLLNFYLARFFTYQTKLKPSVRAKIGITIC